MSISKEEMIQSIYKKYGVMMPDSAKEREIIDAYAGKYSKVEVVNIAKRGKPEKFARAELSTLTRSDIKKFIKKYRKKVVPTGLSRKTLEDILLGKLNVEKLSEKELMIFGKSGRSSITSGVGLYTGIVPGMKKKMKRKDLDRGKKIARRFI